MCQYGFVEHHGIAFCRLQDGMRGSRSNGGDRLGGRLLAEAQPDGAPDEEQRDEAGSHRPHGCLQAGGASCLLQESPEGFVGIELPVGIIACGGETSRTDAGILFPVGRVGIQPILQLAALLVIECLAQ